MSSSRNRTVSRISSAICRSWNINCRTHRLLSCRLIFGHPFAKSLYLISASTCLIIFIQWENNIHLQTNTRDTPEVDRATCCQLPNQQAKDICGRSNCTLPCTKPELEIDSTSNRKSPLSQQHQAFFIESSGNGALSYRQACAVESLALHNPNLTINVLFTDVKINAGLDNIPQKLVENYANIQLMSIDVDEYMAGTVLEHWYQCTNWRSGSYHINNLSNALRLLTVYKFGGYYFDLDIISVRPVTSYRNFVAAVDPEIVNNNVIHADAKHPFIELAIDDFVTNFSSNLWGNNGPDLMFRVLKKWCNAEHVESINYVSCPGFNVLPSPAFHPVHHFQMEQLFAEPTTNGTEEKPISWLTEDVVGVHVWNRMNKDEPIYKKAKHPYKRLVRDHCPLVFSIAPEIF